MADLSQEQIRSLLEAVSFAARAHDGQRRKDGKTPYASHVFRAVSHSNADGRSCRIHAMSTPNNKESILRCVGLKCV